MDLVDLEDLAGVGGLTVECFARYFSLIIIT